MIVLTNLRGVEFVLNCELIEMITSNPDTTITLTNGTLHIVSESMNEVIERTVAYKKRLLHGIGSPLSMT